MSITNAEAEAIAALILNAADTLTPIVPISKTTAFELVDAYRVASLIAGLRARRGERQIGWKIGFTNRTIWEEYGVYAPIWGPMYDSTVQATDDGSAPTQVRLDHLLEPRIEPEIGFRIATPPHPDMDDGELFRCIDAVGHGFEIVQSVYPDWRFRAADTVAAFALHGRYIHARFHQLDNDRSRDKWRAMLADFEVRLYRDGVEADVGSGANVLDGPFQALRHFVAGLDSFPSSRGIEAGDLITTGTVTRAFPVKSGQRWHSVISGLPLQGLSTAFI